MKASDITDEQFLDAMRLAHELRPGCWVDRWDVHAVLDGDLDHVRASAAADLDEEADAYHRVPRHVDVIPEDVVLDKAWDLTERGLLRGCTCGCRGDWELPEWDGKSNDTADAP